MKWAKRIAKDLIGSRPASLQVGALCTRRIDGKLQILLITSRDSGRWVVPKGWPMRGRSLAGAARQEAWEEAGVKGRISSEPVGSFHYEKILDGGLGVPTDVVLYHLKVDHLEKVYPEDHQRKRQWCSPRYAADLVAEDSLKKILLEFKG
ncbi:NUDIX hydrolase [Thioclava dalianensis]|uniref:NUDIX hydrolase n=1 Tax=Thioclava dalianensis TaxID=1185766 RepID=A0A074TL85_9RHOB|nr:NUDIX hydrolase [Thioclava dalianensis]KEP69723.1 NUDIX hydrolase [Thioclava dalianensis]SFM93532.1 8-oxo-dGTP pyrophosphatase MutT, NUDIX family [Thioclava dalianensis]